MFQTIDALDQVVGVGFASLIKNAAVKESITQGTIRDISHGDGVSEEILVQLKPDFFLVYSYGDKDYSIYQKRNIEVIPIAEYLEKTPLGRSEWVVLVGALTGKLDQAKASFQALEQRYFQSQQQVQMLAKPTVFTGYYNSGNWYAPPGNSFVARFLKDAGAQYLFADTLANENLIIPFEKMFVAMHQCQYWGKLAFTPDNPTLENFAADAPQLSQLPSYQAKHLFYCNTQTTDYFGDAVMQPDIILKDLIHIFHPELDTAYQPVYFFAL
jgi:iron complex transport system substrate-binding protein